MTETAESRFFRLHVDTAPALTELQREQLRAILGTVPAQRVAPDAVAA